MDTLNGLKCRECGRRGRLPHDVLKSLVTCAAFDRAPADLESSTAS